VSASTEFEKKFSSLLQEGKKDEAKDHLTVGSTGDLEGLTRVAKCRAVVLMQGQADDVKNAAMAPKWLKLSKAQLFEVLQQGVEEYKSSGKAKAKLKKKAKGTLPGNKKTRRGLSPGGGPPPEGEETAKEEEPDEAEESVEEEAEAKEPEKAAEAPEETETTSDPSEPASVDPGAAQELLEDIKSQVAAQLEAVDEKIGEVLINTSAVVKALSEFKGQEQQSREALQKFEEFNKNFRVLYKQNAFVVESLAFIGAGVMDLGTDEFRQMVLDQMEERAKERAKRMPKSTAKDKGDDKDEGGDDDQ
jgi:hypothetical protein